MELVEGDDIAQRIAGAWTRASPVALLATRIGGAVRANMSCDNSTWCQPTVSGV
jgi:hypothetical protein